jgi:16S rRNA (cytidine1402-2'-O)-methyltransferase
MPVRAADRVGEDAAVTTPRALGTLVLAATPIGNPRDASPRLRDELARADVLAAEDTRRLRRLAADLEVELRGRAVSYHEHNESARTRELVDRLLDGDRVVLVTDAGMPSVSDPGYRLVRAAIRVGITVTCVPGPSAVLMALAVSGMPVDRFCFEGFLPRKPGERTRALVELREERRTMVFFEAPHRLATTLEAMAEAFGPDRHAAACRELTKTYEEVRRGTLAELAEWAVEHARGEISVVVAGLRGSATDVAGVLPGIRERVAAGERLKDVCADVAAQTGLSKKALYDAALAAR